MIRIKQTQFLSMLRGWSLIILVFFLIGCAVRPICVGSQTDLPYAGTKVVVWGSHSGAVAELVTNLQKMKMRIVERAHLKQVIDEQKIILSDSSEDEGIILKVGRILGAETIVFIDVETSSHVVSSAAAYKYVASSHTGTIYHLNVSVRGVSVETGEVIWSGTAHYPRGVSNPEAGIIYLTRSAFARAMCPSGAWSDLGGCDFKKSYGSGYLGMFIGQRKSTQGIQLVITKVLPGSSAQKAGLKEGDILLSCDGKTGMQTLLEYLTTCKKEAGEQVTFEILRDDKIMTISATTVQRPTE